MRLRKRLQRHLLIATMVAACASITTCDRPDPEPPPEPSPTPATHDTSTTQDEDLRERTERIVTFLRGEAPLELELLEDSVALHVAPDGGGDRKHVAREDLQDRSAWRVGRHALLPPQHAMRLTMSAGQHFNCREVKLSSLYPDLARHRHVGVRLEPPTTESCLQVWNMTFVYDGDPGQPLLIAAVYDQWEW